MAATVLGRRLRFPRIPFFRVFYSLTYTILYFITLVFIAITPVTMVYGSIQQSALQYAAMVGSGYVLTALFAIFIYSSRIYTNRSAMSAVGKAYIPIEKGEIGNIIRKMIVKQLQRSAIVAWESRPRDLYGEILLAEQEGLLPPETSSVSRNDYTVGTEIPVDPQNPPWGDVQHPGWSSPSHSEKNKTPDVQYESVITELPHLIEATVVSLAPPDPNMTPIQGEARVADPVVVELLKRPGNMAMREYLTQLSYLGLVQPPAIGQTFLSQYERARFSGKPITADEFNSLMADFAVLLSGMTTLDANIVDEIRKQTTEREQADTEVPALSLPAKDARVPKTPSPTRRSPYPMPSGTNSPVTAREALSSRAATPYTQHHLESDESLGSVIRHSSPEETDVRLVSRDNHSLRSVSSSLPSDVGSVVRHDIEDG